MYLKQSKRIALILSLIMFITTLPANVFAEEKDTIPQEISIISDREEFFDFAKKCNNEAYTKGRRFQLNTDLDLTGAEFIPAAVFAGIFNGNGHTIRGISLSGNASSGGVFLLISDGGLVEDLHLEADIYEGRKSENVGIIAGENRGTVRDCSVSGQIIAERCVGGIVGRNAENGHVENSKNYAVVLGGRRSGGIVGFNEGSISACQSLGDVNASGKTAHEIISEREEKEFAMELADLRVMSTGGIAGVNSGTIANSKNYGKVGIENTGYMVGGVVGYERGMTYGSENHGRVAAIRSAGGVAGNFEPYVTRIYDKDSLDDAADEFDELTEEVTTLHKKVGSEDDKTQANIDVIRAETDALRSTVSGYKAYYRAKDDEIESGIYSRLDAIRGDLDDLDMHYKMDFHIDNSQNGSGLISRLQQLLTDSDSSEELGVPVSMLGTLKTIYDSLSGLRSALGSAIDQIKGGGKRANKKLDKQLKKLEDLRDKLGELDDYLRSTYDSYEADLRRTSDDINARSDRIAAEMDTLSEGLKASDKTIRDQVDKIDDTTQKISETMKQGFEEAKDVLNDSVTKTKPDEIFEDISDSTDASVSMGTLTDCRNFGAVMANTNAGGIVGAIEIAEGSESDFEIVSVGQISMKYRSEKKALIIGCTNKGDISARNSYAGGIVGKADDGAVVSCNSFANVYSKDGSYIGGIAGKSGYTIRDCSAMVSVSGDDYLGGIAGYAKNIYGSRVDANLPKTLEKCGAVAGAVTDDADLADNIYVKNDVGAIYGSAENKSCRAVSYGELRQLDDIQKDFGKVKVTYVDGDNSFKREYAYGTRLTKETLPELETDDDIVAYWDIDLDKPIESNMIVEAVRVPWISTIATEEEIPHLMMTGRFYASTILALRDEAAEDRFKIEKYKVISKHSFSVSSDYGIPEQTYTLRYLNREKADAIAVAKDGRLNLIGSRKDGNYLVFELDDSDTFYCLKKPTEPIVYISITAFALILLAFIIYLKKKGKRS